MLQFVFLWELVFKGYEIGFKCEKHSQLHDTLDLAIIKLPKGKIFRKKKYTQVSIPRGSAEQPNAGDIVYVVGWGRACKENGKECKSKVPKFTCHVL